MIYLLIILTAYWNGLIIAWKHGADTGKLWHSVGWWIRLGLVAIGGLVFLDWGLAVIYPPYLMELWHGLLLGLPLSLVVGKYMYDTTINLTRNKYEGTNFRWSYCGGKDQRFWKAEFYVFMAVSVAWSIWGQHFITWIN